MTEEILRPADPRYLDFPPLPYESCADEETQRFAEGKPVQPIGGTVWSAADVVDARARVACIRMSSREHLDGQSSMRTTVNLDDDVVVGVQKLRRERGLGLSEALNELARVGLVERSRPRKKP